MLLFLQFLQKLIRLSPNHFLSAKLTKLAHSNKTKAIPESRIWGIVTVVDTPKICWDVMTDLGFKLFTKYWNLSVAKKLFLLLKKNGFFFFC